MVSYIHLVQTLLDVSRSKKYGLCSFLKKACILFQGWLALGYMIRTDTAKHKKLLLSGLTVDINSYLQNVLVK